LSVNIHPERWSYTPTGLTIDWPPHDHNVPYPSDWLRQHLVEAEISEDATTTATDDLPPPLTRVRVCEWANDKARQVLATDGVVQIANMCAEKLEAFVGSNRAVYTSELSLDHYNSLHTGAPHLVHTPQWAVLKVCTCT
jgi:hypothetical protein